MPQFRMRSYDAAPPGGYFYVQPEPKGHHFRKEPMIEPLARQVSSYRKGNGLPNSSYAESLVDVDRFMATNVLSGNPAYTVQLDADTQETVPLLSNAPGLAPCKGCGIPTETT